MKSSPIFEIVTNANLVPRITRPSTLRSNEASPVGQNVILYLPPGTLFRDHHTEASKIDGDSTFNVDHAKTGDIQAPKHAPSPQHVLANSASAVVVTVNYRLGETKQQISPTLSTSSPQGQNETPDQTLDATNTNPQPETYKYPTPVHDTLAGFDWIQTNLQPSKLAIYGTHIGGSLALMLALTEAQSIHAVAATNPVCDWPSLDEYCTRENNITNTDLDSENNGPPPSTVAPKQKRHHARKRIAPKDLVPLLRARERFFTSPERFFDSFASPILFLRSAGREVPRTFPSYLTGPEYPVPVLRNTRNMTAAEQYDAADGSLWDRDVYPNFDSEDGDGIDNLAGTVTRRRKALSRWPPYGLDYGLSGKNWSGPGDGIRRLEVCLPVVRIFAGDGVGKGLDSLSAGEGEGPLARKGGKGKDGSVTTVLARQAEEMVSVMRRACFWGREKGFGERRVVLSRVLSDVDQLREVGDWFKDVFEGTMDDVD